MAGVWCELRQRHRSVCVPAQKDRERTSSWNQTHVQETLALQQCVQYEGKKWSSLPVAAVSPDDSSEEVFLAPQVRVTVGNVIKIVFVRLLCATWTPHFLCLAHSFNYKWEQCTPETLGLHALSHRTHCCITLKPRTLPRSLGLCRL